MQNIEILTNLISKKLKVGECSSFSHLLQGEPTDIQLCCRVARVIAFFKGLTINYKEQTRLDSTFHIAHRATMDFMLTRTT